MTKRKKIFFFTRIRKGHEPCFYLARNLEVINSQHIEIKTKCAKMELMIGASPGLGITTSGWMELHTNFQNQLMKPPRVRSENTLQLRALSWIPTYHPAGTKEAHIDLVCAGN
jgi:hypothetical protein